MNKHLEAIDGITLMDAINYVNKLELVTPHEAEAWLFVHMTGIGVKDVPSLVKRHKDNQEMLEGMLYVHKDNAETLKILQEGIDASKVYRKNLNKAITLAGENVRIA
jgi:hypothetical protein